MPPLSTYAYRWILNCKRAPLKIPLSVPYKYSTPLRLSHTENASRQSDMWLYWLQCKDSVTRQCQNARHFDVRGDIISPHYFYRAFTSQPLHVKGEFHKTTRNTPQVISVAGDDVAAHKGLLLKFNCSYKILFSRPITRRLNFGRKQFINILVHFISWRLASAAICPALFNESGVLCAYPLNSFREVGS